MDINKFLMTSADEGKCLQLVYDDEGHWAISDTGSMTVGGKSPDIVAMVLEKWWENSPEEAIANYIEREANPEPLSPEDEKAMNELFGVEEVEDER